MKELVEALAVTAEVCGTDLSTGAATVMAAELAEYDRAQVLGALRKCRRELKGRLTMAAVIERLDDGRPGPEEAWAIVPKDDAATVVWTGEMAEAYGVALPLLVAGEMVAARMAFKETYTRLVAEARDSGRRVAWSPSIGWDHAGREAVISDAVRKGRLSADQALGLGYEQPIAPEVLQLIKGVAR